MAIKSLPPPLLLLLLLWGVAGFHFNVIVDQSPGSGHYQKVGDAIAAAPRESTSRYTILIRRGVYRENLLVPADKPNLMLVGEGAGRTVIWGSRSASQNIRTYDTATVGINGVGFAAIDISFVNGAGPKGMQAVALRSDVQSAFYRCDFIGYQDTLYAKSERQFYRECKIYGTVDFIFGDAAVVFQNCEIYARNPGTGKQNTITAQGRKTPGEPGGTVLHNCSIKATRDLQKQPSVKTYLGRPWENYSRVIIMQSSLDGWIDPQGWLEWQGHRTDQLFYAEYQNRGLGNATGGRVKWAGVRVFNKPQEASPFTVRNFLQGHEWIPDVIPFNLDLIQ